MFTTRYGYSYGGAAFMWEQKNNFLMFAMFCRRLTQLAIKTAQYKLLGKKDLVKSFSSDLRGFLDGWAMWHKLKKEGVKPAAQC